jgi:uncharacterized repeat protein (TIGR03803 family)
MFKLRSYQRVLTGCVVSLLFVSVALGQYQEDVLHTFTGPDGANSRASLISDTNGNLFGTTPYGGTFNQGTIFELSPDQSGNWNFSVLYSFAGELQNDGGQPYAALVMDENGNLFGTTVNGGAFDLGTVFELKKSQPVGTWTEILLYNFGAFQGDGEKPEGGLIFDGYGDLFGTTPQGGSSSTNCRSGSPSGCGTVFELIPSEGGRWTETILYNFIGGEDGYGPVAGLTFDSQGNLFGTTNWGGDVRGCYGYTCGTVFELKATRSGGWTETLLHNFNGRDGAFVLSEVVLDSSGNLYGTTWLGGDLSCSIYGCGTIFRLSPNGVGDWSFAVIHKFTGISTDGAGPNRLVFDKSGNLFGSTAGGGDNGTGTIYEVERSGVMTIFDGFGGNGGTEPYAGVTLDDTGRIFGTTISGGSMEDGVVFELTK